MHTALPPSQKSPTQQVHTPHYQIPSERAETHPHTKLHHTRKNARNGALRSNFSELQTPTCNYLLQLHRHTQHGRHLRHTFGTRCTHTHISLHFGFSRISQLSALCDFGETHTRVQHARYTLVTKLAFETRNSFKHSLPPSTIILALHFIIHELDSATPTTRSKRITNPLKIPTQKYQKSTLTKPISPSFLISTGITQEKWRQQRLHQQHHAQSQSPDP